MYSGQEVFDTNALREADRLAITSGVSGITLMENAGRAVASEIQKRWAPRPVAVLCGPGNNGGDGFAAARYLADAGWPVKVGLLCDKDALQGDARHHAGLWCGSVEPLSPSLLDGAELVVDALFGAGLSRPVGGVALDVLTCAAGAGIPVVAVDVPSGVMGDSGEVAGAVLSVLTVTFFRKKPAHLLLPGRHACGEVVVADIGIPETVTEELHPKVFENDPKLWRKDLPRITFAAHKYTRGHALIYGGYPMTGAARLAARGAARSGAGLVSIACLQAAFAVYAASLSSIMVKPLVRAQDFVKLLDDKRFSAALIGPGAGVKAEVRQLSAALLDSGIPIVLDADAITMFTGEPSGLKRAIAYPCVLTPHEGEFRRVFEFSGDKLTRARMAATYSGAVVVLKGSDTVIASPDGRAMVNSNAPATLATAGSGDVLSGMIVGLLAQGMEAFHAAAAAVWMHGAAAAEFGPGLVAEDIPDLLPRIWRRLAV